MFEWITIGLGLVRVIPRNFRVLVASFTVSAEYVTQLNWLNSLNIRETNSLKNRKTACYLAAKKQRKQACAYGQLTHT